MTERIKIFADGEHNTKSAKKSWNLDDLKQILKATQEAAIEKIPFTTFHPDNDLPVFGYADAKSLRLEREPSGRNTLTIQPIEFAENFKPLLKQIGLNKVSIRLTKDKVLKHIGLVDAPAVKDLGFAFEQKGTEDGDDEFEFSEQTKPESFMTQLEIDALKAQKEKAEADAKAAKEKADALLAEKASAEAKVAEAEFSASIDKFFAEQAKNRLTPKQQAIFKRIANAVRKTDFYEFSAEDGKTVKTGALAELQEFIKSLPEISKSEMATEGAAFAGDKKKYERKKPPSANRMMELLSTKS